MDTSERRWRHLLLAVLTEIDTDKFSVRLTAADDAVFQRLLQLEGTDGTDEERLALEEALMDIQLLRHNCYQMGS
jgi:hypothetical protein